MLRLIGCNHRTCPLEVREKLSVPNSAVPAFLRCFRQQFPTAEVVLLSTCNRMELYTAHQDDSSVPTVSAMIAFLANYFGLMEGTLGRILYCHEYLPAVRHLFVVTASLDSMILGESQILGQVKEAYALACRSASVGTWTHKAFQSAIRTARRVAAETELNRLRVSIPSIAVGDCVRQVFEHLCDKSVYVLGAGEMALETLHALQDEGARHVTILNRDVDRGRQVAGRFGVQCGTWEDLPQAFIHADLIISATGATQPIVHLDDFRGWESLRYQRTLLLLDFGVPRDFDPRIGSRLGVFLFSLDDFQALGERHRRQRAAELPRAERIIDEETQAFTTDMQQRQVAPTIQQLRAESSHVQELELRRLFDKLPWLDPIARREIRHTLHRVEKKLLHPIMRSLKQLTSDSNTAPIDMDRCSSDTRHLQAEQETDEDSILDPRTTQ